MYDFTPTDEQQMLIEWVQRFAAADLRPAAREAEETGGFPRALLKKGWGLGILPGSIPEKYGGYGERSAVTGVLALEELAWGDLAGALALTSPALFAIPVLLAGSEAQKQAYLPAILAAENLPPYTAAVLEPSFDFDPMALKTTAVQDNGQYVITGEKTMVPMAATAQYFLVYARFNGQTEAFIVPAETPGIVITDRCKLLGFNALHTYGVHLEGVRVPLDHRLGFADGEPAGFPLTSIFDASRLAAAALGVGLSRAAFEYARDYAKEREAFGAKIAQKQAIAFMLAEMATEIEAIRLLVWQAAWMADQRLPEAGKRAYLAYCGAADLAMMVTDRAVQILGGHGYIREHPVELWMRNGRGIATLTGLAML